MYIEGIIVKDILYFRIQYYSLHFLFVTLLLLSPLDWAQAKHATINKLPIVMMMMIFLFDLVSKIYELVAIILHFRKIFDDAGNLTVCTVGIVLGAIPVKTNLITNCSKLILVWVFRVLPQSKNPLL